MSSFVDMSLEDIIQKKRNVNRRPYSNAVPPKEKINQPPMQKIPISDARNKIVSKKRNQITDAREILANLARQRDARLKLEMLRQKRGVQPATFKGQPNLVSSFQPNVHVIRGQRNAAFRSPQYQVSRGHQNVGKQIRNVGYRERNPTRQVASRPLGLRVKKTVSPKQNITKKFLNNRTIGRRPFDKSLLKPIVRTIENDVEIIDDPMDVDDEDEIRNAMLNRKATLELKIVAKNDAANQVSRISSVRRSPNEEREKSPPRPPSILKKRPMAALRMDERQEKPAARTNLEYRIIVSNLRNTVTGGDIEELFGDVGNMIESRLVRPGTAEVIYKNMEDAQRAVELYHNRQLDGQAMNCLLVTPRSPAVTSARSTSTSKPALISTNSNVEPDPSTFHKVMFSTY